MEKSNNLFLTLASSQCPSSEGMPGHSVPAEAATARLSKQGHVQPQECRSPEEVNEGQDTGKPDPMCTLAT